MVKKIGITLILTNLVLFAAFAQSLGSVVFDKAEAETIVDEDRGFNAQIKIETNLFQMTSVTFQDAQQRWDRTSYFLIDNLPFGANSFFGDTYAAFGYNGDWFGGKFSVNNGGLGGIRAWLGFLNNKIKISAGNDIGYGYADSQGADAGLRVYDDHLRNKKDAFQVVEIDSNRNPDNITQDRGVLVEINLDPFKFALAGSGNIENPAKNTGSVISDSKNAAPLYGHNAQYGLNIGGAIGSLAKINGAYVFHDMKDATGYEYNGAADTIIAKGPDSAINTHLFGAYAGLYPFRDDTLGITLGYAGVMVHYLDSFSVSSKTAVPFVFKNGLNLTARYRKDRLTVKTDHNYSFWIDKNYKIFYLYKPDRQKMQDFGLLAKSNGASDVSDVSHMFIWNGIGASYLFTEIFEGSIYTRNLIRIDETPEFKMINDYYSLELKAVFHLTTGVEAFAGITCRYTSRSVNERLALDLGEYKSPYAPKATSDSSFMLQVPIGFSMKLQK